MTLLLWIITLYTAYYFCHVLLLVYAAHWLNGQFITITSLGCIVLFLLLLLLLHVLLHDSSIPIIEVTFKVRIISVEGLFWICLYCWLRLILVWNTLVDDYPFPAITQNLDSTDKCLGNIEEWYCCETRFHIRQPIIHATLHINYGFHTVITIIYEAPGEVVWDYSEAILA